MMNKESNNNNFWGGKSYLPLFISLINQFKVYILSIISIAIITFLLVYPLHSALTFTNGKTSQMVGVIPLDTGEAFAIHYIHSIHKTPVKETYKIDNDYQIIVDEVEYESYGIGMPSTFEPGQSFRQENGKYVISNINRTLPYFDQSVGQVAANHQLLIHNKTIPLSIFTEPGNWLRIQMKKVSLIRIWKEGARTCQNNV